MRLRLFLAALLLLATVCSVQSVQARIQSDKQDEKSAEKESAQDPSDDEAEEEKGPEEKLKELEFEYTVGQKKFQNLMRRARTRAARDKAIKANPMIELGPKFVAFAKQHAGTPQAFAALQRAAATGQGEAKTDAMEMLLTLVEKDPKAGKARSALEILALQGAGKPRARAMALLMEKTDADPESEDARKIYSMLAFARGDDESKSKAIERLFGLLETDADSDESFDDLLNFAMRGAGDLKTKATDMLIENHVNNEKINNLMQSMSRGLPSRQAEQWLKTISEESVSPKIKVNAIFGRIAFLDNLKSFKNFLDGADEERVKSFPEDVREFVYEERDAKELDELEKMLESFIEGQQGLLKRAEKELFALQHLSIGREAPDIVGLDLDGVEFKLSDYRGKVVFLDFWGDW